MSDSEERAETLAAENARKDLVVQAARAFVDAKNSRTSKWTEIVSTMSVLEAALAANPQAAPAPAEPEMGA